MPELPTIQVFNTLSSEKEPLNPAIPGRIRLYVCGPTVYNYIHIGNARTFTSFDVVVRYLRARGYQVDYVRNFTDVDDKIIQAARETGEAPVALAQRYIDAFREDARALHLVEPDVSPKVSDHIPEIVAIISRLIERGIAYESMGDVYFQVSRYPPYAKLSRRNLDELRAGARVEPGEQKREPLDFALWKAAKPGEPSWSSPWGPGRPGWHIECSAMSAKYLGESFDLHGGGRDLIFPHHENEIAQSEAASGKPFARYWMHCEFLDLEGAKMSKSLGNVVRLRDALNRVDAEALRLFFLSTHYRNPLSFSDKSLYDAETRMEYFYETLRRVDERGSVAAPAGPSRHLEEFHSAMDDDFNVPRALAAVSALFAEMNELLDRPAKDRAATAKTLGLLREDVRRIASALGILEDQPAQWLARRRDRLVERKGIDRPRVESLITDRSAARAKRDFSAADRIRSTLAEMGVEIMDTPGGTTWKVTP